MAEPYDRPPVGSGAKLYRMIRDNAYYVAGTVLSLLPEQVNPLMHEPVAVEAPDTDALHGAVADLHDRVKTIESDEELRKSITALEKTVGDLVSGFVAIKQANAATTAGLEKRIADLEAMKSAPPQKDADTPAKAEPPAAG